MLANLDVGGTVGLDHRSTTSAALSFVLSLPPDCEADVELRSMLAEHLQTAVSAAQRSFLLGLAMSLCELSRRTSLYLTVLYRPDQQHRCTRAAAFAERTCWGRCTEIRLHELGSEECRLIAESPRRDAT